MNPVYLEMVKLGKKWDREVKQNPGAITYVLLGQKTENQLFETFFKYQLSDDARTEDVYLIFYQPFEERKTYTQSLIAEIASTLDDWKKSGADVKDWVTGEGDAEEIFVHSMVNLSKAYPVFQQNKIFIQLAPTAISDRLQYEAWLAGCGAAIEKQEAGNFIKLVFTDHENYPTIDAYYKPHFWKYPVNISNLMEKTAENTNRRKGAKENNFQQLILKAGNHLARKKYADADILLEQATRLSIASKFLQGAVLAKIIRAQNKSAESKTTEAEELYCEAMDNAKENHELQAQVMFSYGAFLLSQKERKRANDIFENIAQIGAMHNNAVLQIEANRLIGQMEDTRYLSGKAAVPYYEKCIAIAETMPDAERKETSIPYIASLLLKKYGSQEQKSSELEKKMIDMFGEGWQKLAAVPDLKKLKKFENGGA
ncbi:MAG: hypothetical protein IT249_04985 [Chitinophagaceae bacterium]|nr:hypothetical protein [Chitinophagaceae bacterium]